MSIISNPCYINYPRACLFFFQKKPNSGLPLSESQERNVTSELQQAPPKLSSDAKLLATEKQLGDIRHSFEYIAANVSSRLCWDEIISFGFCKF